MGSRRVRPLGMQRPSSSYHEWPDLTEIDEGGREIDGVNQRNQKMHIAKTMGLAVVAIALAACDGGRDKQFAGTLVGAAAGGAIGSQIGSGSGRAVAIGTGVLIGGLVGNQVGRHLDDQDRELAARNAQYSLNSSRSGASSSWRNPDTGHSGTFTPAPAYQGRQGQWCREGTHSVWVDGREEMATATYCRDGDGYWRAEG